MNSITARKKFPTHFRNVLTPNKLSRQKQYSHWLYKPEGYRYIIFWRLH